MACIFMVFFHSFFILFSVPFYGVSLSLTTASKIKWQMRSLLTANRNNTLHKKKECNPQCNEKKMWARIKMRTKKNWRAQSFAYGLKLLERITIHLTNKTIKRLRISFAACHCVCSPFFNINILFSCKPYFIHNCKINNTPFQFSITSNVQIYSIAHYDDCWGLNQFQAFGLKYKLMLFIYLFWGHYE